jgi:hypothetical protein
MLKMPKTKKKSDVKSKILSIALVHSTPLEWRGCFENGDYFFLRVEKNGVIIGRHERELMAYQNAYVYELKSLDIEKICEDLKLELPDDYINLDN